VDSLVAACSQFMNWSTCSGFANNFAPLVVNNLLKLNL
jgi:hypothetical protein